MRSAARRGLIAALVVVLAAVVVVLGARALLHTWQGNTRFVGCTVGRFQIDNDQAATASTMVGVVLQRNLPERAAVLALAAALQESKIRNLASGAGDRDSVGVLQQRPSQGWGTEEQLSDVRYATGKFLDALVKIPDWQSADLADTIQQVQVSADGSLYAQHEAEAQALADAFTGKAPTGISCYFPTPSQVATAQATGQQVSDDLPVNPPMTTASTVAVPGASWATTAWFVANADRLGIDSVGYAGKQWTRAKGWRDAPTAPAGAVVATLHH